MVLYLEIRASLQTKGGNPPAELGKFVTSVKDVGHNRRELATAVEFANQSLLRALKEKLLDGKLEEETLSKMMSPEALEALKKKKKGPKAVEVVPEKKTIEESDDSVAFK